MLAELEGAGIPGLVIEEDEQEARRLLERQRRVIFARIEEEGLSGAHMERARALIANGRDDENAALILAARQSGFAGEILALVEEPMHRKPMMLAGASAAYTPRHILAAVLAARASESVSPALTSLHRVGAHLEIQEIRVQPDSPLAGKTLAQAQIAQPSGATVVGQWIGGQLQVHPQANAVIEPRGTLVAVGRRKDQPTSTCANAPAARSWQWNETASCRWSSDPTLFSPLGDTVYICGSSEAIHTFSQRFP